MVSADSYIFILVTFVYIYKKDSLFDYLPISEEYDLSWIYDEKKKRDEDDEEFFYQC